MRSVDQHRSRSGRRIPIPGRPLLLVVAAAVILFCAGWVAADARQVFLRVRSVHVWKGPSVESGPDKQVVYAGQAFEVLDKQGDWVRVRFSPRDPSHPDKKEDVREAWVHATVVGNAPRSERADRTPWVREGGEGIRKVDPTAQERVYLKRKRLDLANVEKLEQFYPSTEELEEFLKQGKLGLYRTDWPSLAEGVER